MCRIEGHTNVSLPFFVTEMSREYCTYLRSLPSQPNTGDRIFLDVDFMGCLYYCSATEKAGLTAYLGNLDPRFRCAL